MRPATVFPAIHFERIDSTNAEARRLAEVGNQGPLWIVADEQTAGRGRLGRTWVSEPGNLYATLLLPLTTGIACAGQLSFVAALAVHDVIAELAPSLNARIKWPNDVLIDGRKVCGVLAEVVNGAPALVAIGCGLNVAHAPEGAIYPVTALARHGVSADVSTVLGILDTKMRERLSQWDEGRGFGAIRAAWSAQVIGLGSNVSIVAGGRTIAGRFAALGEDGALIVETGDGLQVPVHAGDVRFTELECLRQART